MRPGLRLILGSLAVAGAGALGTSGVAQAQGDSSAQERALKALGILGADVNGSSHRCAGCHDLNVRNLKGWMEQTQFADWDCFRQADPGDPTMPIPTPMERIDCMRSDPSNPSSPFSAGRLGIFAAGAHTDFFKGLFQAAFPADQWQAKYDEFALAVQMPMTGTLMTPEEFEHVRLWTLDGMPFLRDLLGDPSHAPNSCTTEITPDLTAHITRMATEGWAAKNRDSGMMMFACPSGADELACFTMKDASGVDLFPEATATPFGVSWISDMPEAKLRVLRELPFETSYWMRSSPDGRFLGNGAYGISDPSDPGRWGGMISDLAPQMTRGASYRDIKVDASFDPSFFPDNSGFVFQGTSVGTGFCRMSFIENPATTKVNWTAPECSSGRISLYQSVGATLDGSDYLAITGSFAGDGGGGRTHGDGVPSWDDDATITVTPIVNDGQAYRTMPATTIDAPWLADWGLSPSNVMTAARVAGVDAQGVTKQMGYQFHFLERETTPTGYSVTMREAGTICADGGKGAFSFDERMYTIYHYVDQDDWAELGFASEQDPAFQELLRKGSANVYVLDLLTGASTRVTRMGAGQFALFPHYRSDGWLYFMVYDQNTHKRYAAVSDASIRLSRGESSK